MLLALSDVRSRLVPCPISTVSVIYPEIVRLVVRSLPRRLLVRLQRLHGGTVTSLPRGLRRLIGQHRSFPQYDRPDKGYNVGKEETNLV